MSKKIDDILNPPPPPPNRDEASIVEFLKSEPDSAFRFDEIFSGTALHAGVSSIGTKFAFAVIGEFLDPQNQRKARLVLALEKLVKEGMVDRKTEEETNTVYYWLARKSRK